MDNRITRMRCGKDHPKLYPLPDGYTVDWMGVAPWIVEKVARESGGYRYHALLFCSEPDCQRRMRAFVVEGRHSDKTQCGARCMGATGPSCECSCNGENHGVGS